MVNRLWCFIENDVITFVPKRPLELAGLAPPCTVKLVSTGEERFIFEQSDYMIMAGEPRMAWNYAPILEEDAAEPPMSTQPKSLEDALLEATGGELPALNENGRPFEEPAETVLVITSPANVVPVTQTVATLT